MARGTFVFMDKDMERLLEKVKKELKEIGIPISNNILGVTVNSRTKRRLGACRKIKRLGHKTGYFIEISKIVTNCDDQVICRIMAHELIHTCPGCFDHGKKWKEYGAKAERLLGYKISRTSEYRELGIEEQATEKVKYVIKCKNCGQVYERKRICPLVRNPERYRCGKCGSPLEKG